VAGWLAHPWLLAMGVAAMTLPVLIHLLHRRKFVVVEWAAMEFLLEAERTNRRRIRLQHWLLLLLRMAAVGLIGLMLARPFVPTAVTAGLVGEGAVERILILDDSLSMQARAANESAWDVARRNAVEMLQRWADQKGTDSTVTVYLSSEPEQPLMSGEPIGGERGRGVVSRIEQLTGGEGSVPLSEVLGTLESSLAATEGGANRAVYVFSDMRREDWQALVKGDGKSEAAADLLGPLGRIRQLVQGCNVVDAGHEEQGNLTIVEVRADGPVVTGVSAGLDVTVKNQGMADAADVRVKLSVANGLPAVERIERLKAGDSTTVRFPVMFNLAEVASGSEQAVQQVDWREVRVGLEAKAAVDRLREDSVGYFAARVTRGMRVLLIDGAGDAADGEGESYFLKRALAPEGPVPSGIVTQVVGEQELETIELENYDVIFWLNGYRLYEQAEGSLARGGGSLARLDKWVARGGSLVLMPGDQVDASQFNAGLWREGRGLSPLKLEAIRGDKEKTSWVGIRFKVSTGSIGGMGSDLQVLFEPVKVFRRWQVTAAEGEGTVWAHWNDSEQSPAGATKSWGKGHVVAFAIPADADWHDWPSHPSFVLLFQELVRGLTSAKWDQARLRVGESIDQPVDIGEFEPQGRMMGPGDSGGVVQAALPKRDDPENSAIWQITYPATHLGFYELSLTRRDGGDERLLFAVNADKREGDLKRVERSELKRELAETRVGFVVAEEAAMLEDEGGRTEVWWYLALLLGVALAGEQVLGWFFGRQRQ
jgi:hypothetical protein